MEAHPRIKHSIQFTFQTTVPNVHFLTGESILNNNLYSIGLFDGYLYIKRLENSKILDRVKLNDGDWYEVVFVVSQDGISLEVSHVQTGYVIVDVILDTIDVDVFSVRFGRVKDGVYFVGCIKNVIVDGREIDMFNKQ